MDPGQLEIARLKVLKDRRDEWAKRSVFGDPPLDDATVHPGLIATKCREGIRNAENGLLILYPLDPLEAGLSEESDPIMGWAVSFPASPGAPDDVQYVIAKEFGAAALAEELSHVD
jgi:hypothetical protein